VPPWVLRLGHFVHLRGFRGFCSDNILPFVVIKLTTSRFSLRSCQMRFVPLFGLLLILSACFPPNNPPYLVYFQERSALLDAPARSLIAEAARRGNAEPTAPVTVAGYTDSAGSPPADVLLSQQRAQTVADALARDGVAANRIVRTGRGQTGGDPGIASRRVEITIGGV
jgi:OmpA family